MLEALERRDAPLLVHPGPAPAAPPRRAGLVGRDDGLRRGDARGLVRLRRLGPAGASGLRVCFAMLAGLAPLQRERLTARGGRAGADAGVFLDVSSYGERAVDAVVREIGVDRLVFGSDRPVVAPRELWLGDAVRAAIRERNPRTPARRRGAWRSRREP